PPLPALRTFPTRRSSDLCDEPLSFKKEIASFKICTILSTSEFCARLVKIKLICSPTNRHIITKTTRRFSMWFLFTKYYLKYLVQDRKSTRLNSSHVSISY